jgi:Dehydrogenases (flavoproteins)
MSRIFDLAVIGGGPAGTAAAITAAHNGHRALLLESGSFPRHKVCGEFVSAEALMLLEKLLGSNSLTEAAPRISHARIFLDDRVVNLPVAPAAASVSRYGLDLALWNSALTSGVACLPETRVVAVRRSTSGTFSLQTEAADFEARAVINATGRWSNLTSPSAVEAKTNSVGLKAHFFESEPAVSCDLYFFEGGYCGVQPVASNAVNVSAMVRVEVARTLEGVFAQSRQLLQRSRKWSQATARVSTAPLIFREARTSENGMLQCGDAAAFIDPFAGDGISMALHSGSMAAASLDSFLRGESSLECAIQGYAELHRIRLQPALKNAAQLRRLLRLPRMLRGAALSLMSLSPIARLAVHQTRARADEAA